MYNFDVNGCTHVPFNRCFSYIGSVQRTEEVKEDRKDRVAKDVEFLVDVHLETVVGVHLRYLGCTHYCLVQCITFILIKVYMQGAIKRGGAL